MVAAVSSSHAQAHAQVPAAAQQSVAQAPMTTLKLVAPSDTDTHTPAMPLTATHHRLRLLLTALHGALGVAAIVSGAMLVAQPSGAPLGLTTEALRGFNDFFIPGFLLALLGLAQLLVAVYTRRPGAAPMTASHWAGAFAVMFVAFQSAIVIPLVPFALAVGLMGVFIYSLANELHRDEPHTPLLP